MGGGVRMTHHNIPIGELDSVLRIVGEIRENGIECMRCRTLQKTPREIQGVFIFVAHTAYMPTPSPPHVLCEECGYRAAAFMGVEAAKRIVETKYGG